MKNKIRNIYLKASIASLLFASTAAVAGGAGGGGLEKVNVFVENITTMLTGISVGVVTVAIMWAGYKFLFKHADLGEVGKIVAGGLLIGGAGQLASYLLA